MLEISTPLLIAIHFDSLIEILHSWGRNYSSDRYSQLQTRLEQTKSSSCDKLTWNQIRNMRIIWSYLTFIILMIIRQMLFASKWAANWQNSTILNVCVCVCARVKSHPISKCLHLRFWWAIIFIIIIIRHILALWLWLSRVHKIDEDETAMTIKSPCKSITNGATGAETNIN